MRYSKISKENWRNLSTKALVAVIRVGRSQRRIEGILSRSYSLSLLSHPQKISKENWRDIVPMVINHHGNVFLEDLKGELKDHGVKLAACEVFKLLEKISKENWRFPFLIVVSITFAMFLSKISKENWRTSTPCLALGLCTLRKISKENWRTYFAQTLLTTNSPSRRSQRRIEGIDDILGFTSNNYLRRSQRRIEGRQLFSLCYHCHHRWIRRSQRRIEGEYEYLHVRSTLTGTHGRSQRRIEGSLRHFSAFTSIGPLRRSQRRIEGYLVKYRRVHCHLGAWRSQRRIEGNLLYLAPVHSTPIS